MNKHMIKKEIRENMYVSKGLWMIVICSLLLTSLCVLICSLKEAMALPQNTVIEYAVKVVLLITLIIAMVLGASCFASEREENTLESLLLTPVSKRGLTFSKYTGVLALGALFFIVAVPYLIAIGAGTGLVFNSILYMVITGNLLLLAFTAIAVFFSITMKSSKTAILVSLLALFILFIPAFTSGMFNGTAFGRSILNTNPVYNSFKLMTAILNKDSFLTMFKCFYPIVIFTALCIGLMVWGSRKINLKGEK